MLIGLFHQNGRTDDEDDEDDNDELTCQHEAGRKEGSKKGGGQLLRKEGGLHGGPTKFDSEMQSIPVKLPSFWLIWVIYC